MVNSVMIVTRAPDDRTTQPYRQDRATGSQLGELRHHGLEVQRRAGLVVMHAVPAVVTAARDRRVGAELRGRLDHVGLCGGCGLAEKVVDMPGPLVVTALGPVTGAALDRAVARQQRHGDDRAGVA